MHGARLDVYLEEDSLSEDAPENATIYDVEPDNNSETQAITALPKRVRFYHAKRDKGVSVGYMKVYEREEMLLNKGIQQGISQGIQRGREAERANTERERKRADLAEEENRRLKEEIEQLKKQ